MPRHYPPPEALDAIGGAFWEAVQADLPDGTLDKAVHRLHLILFANAYAGYTRLMGEFRGDEVVHRRANGGKTSEEVNARMRAANEYLSVVKHYSKMFGLTPYEGEKLKSIAARTDARIPALNLDDED